jgi:2,3-dihydroxyphenylpropionate 1,2-dioxygenase
MPIAGSAFAAFAMSQGDAAMTPVVSSPPRNVRLICASHSPMMEFIHPDPAVEQAARGAFADLAREVADYDPQLIVLFAPDHFNGFFYDLMPPFCLGIRARGAGDWDYSTDPLDVPEDVALDLVRFVQDQGVDLAYSYRMQADHGFTQPLALLAGDVARYPVLPIFVNGAAHPAPPIHRAGAGARGRAVPGSGRAGRTGADPGVGRAQPRPADAPDGQGSARGRGIPDRRAQSHGRSPGAATGQCPVQGGGSGTG